MPRAKRRTALSQVSIHVYDDEDDVGIENHLVKVVNGEHRIGVYASKYRDSPSTHGFCLRRVSRSCRTEHPRGHGVILGLWT